MDSSFYNEDGSLKNGSNWEQSEQSNNDEFTKDLFLRFSMVTHPFGLPLYPEVSNAGVIHFDDPGLKCIIIRNGAEKIYKYELTKKVKREGQYLTFTCADVERKFPLISNDPSKRRFNYNESGTLLTFKKACERENHSETIDNMIFDKAVQAFSLKLDRPTQAQRVKGENGGFTGNRFCVVSTPDDMDKIPEFLPIRHPQTNRLYEFKVTYKGQARFCARCMKKHVGACPSMKAFYDAINDREQIKNEGEINTKISSDSSFRLADPLGLKAEVCTMSGGGLGQVAQTILDDPENKEMETFYLVGGANDIKNTKFENNKQFCENIIGVMDKISTIANEHPTKNFTIVKSHAKDTNVTSDAQIRKEYLHKKIEIEVEKVPNLHTIDTTYDTDETNHPSQTGTYEILRDIDKHKKIIWNENYITTNRYYRSVQSAYLYGCNHCREYGEKISHDKYNNPILCDDCHEAVVNKATLGTYPVLDGIMKELKDKMEEMFNVDVDFSKKGAKREKRDDSSGEELNQTPKKVRNTSDSSSSTIVLDDDKK